MQIRVVLRVLSLFLSVCGAAVVLAGCFAAWANVRVLHVGAGLPGFLFAEGGLCLSAALLVLLGARKWPFACVVLAVFVLWQAHSGQTAVPRRVRSQLIGAQMSAFPINRLLDQFHIPDVEVADVSRPASDLLGAGVGWTLAGGATLLLGGLLGLPTDPAAVWVYRQTARTVCPHCRRRWKKARAAWYCPSCGTELVPADRRPCCHCSRMPEKGDRCCAGCGQSL